MLNGLVKKYVGSVVRHALTGAGGVLIYVGVNEAEVTTLVDAAVPVATGIAVFASGLLSSFIEKKARSVF
jgi:tetrahydromethanopterin S-methyltransferase subunit D